MVYARFSNRIFYLLKDNFMATSIRLPFSADHSGKRCCIKVSHRSLRLIVAFFGERITKPILTAPLCNIHTVFVCESIDIRTTYKTTIDSCLGNRRAILIHNAKDFLGLCAVGVSRQSPACTLTSHRP